ncbi:MAG: protoheme IX farnesyltransferase [Candidatus Eremiobacteraeota bacterium]|nr:protoheme IX farnesyltransferase [Candidatus Eremiobacteraeota bacterium]
MSSTLSRVDGVLPRHSGGLPGIVSDFYELSKPRIIYLLLITTAAAMIMAARGIPHLQTLLWTLLGGGLASASAGAFNCIVDSDIDGLMRRTCARPIPTGRMSIRSAAIYAVATGIISFAILILLVNPLAAWLSLAGNVYYVVIYTMMLKRVTPLNIVIGGAAGAIPPLVGWAAVTGTIGGPAIGLFMIIFLWTPPHFWSLALMTEIDYDKAKIPMLPNVSGVARTKLEILIYSIVLVAASLALWYPFHVMGWIYLAAAAILGGIFLYGAVRVLTQEGKTWPRWLFKFSLLYLALMCLALVIDRIFA